MLPGLHRVRVRGAQGVSEYWYAWRGGPQILRARAPTESALDLEIHRLAPKALAQFEAQSSTRSDRRFLAGLIAAYLAGPKYLALAPRTQADYRQALDVVRIDLGETAVADLGHPTMRRDLIRWRDSYNATPKTADARMSALAMVLAWAFENGEAPCNPLTSWPRIYKSNRADLIWTADDLAAIRPHLSPRAVDAVDLAINTGLRLSDLVALPWSAVKESAIIWQTGKSRGRRTVIIPRFKPLDDLLGRLPRPQASSAVTVLLSAKGAPWTDEGLQTAMQRAKQALPADHPARRLTFHDLRGTAATRFVQQGMAIEDVATILGWEKRNVEAIAARYVSGEAIAMAIVERTRKNARGTSSVKNRKVVKLVHNADEKT